MTTIDRRRRGRRTDDKAKDSYLAALSHELRTPLGGVLGMADLLDGTTLDAEQRTYVTAIRDSGRHLLGLVNDVLDLAKIEAGKLELHREPVEPEALLRGVAELLSPRAHDKGLEIAWAVQGDAAPVLADEARLRQILFNLAGNALKFTDRGGVLITLSVSPSAAGGRRLRFEVTDSGPGIAADQHERIFQPFAQAPGASRTAESTGLGLALVAQLVRAMDGALGLDSTPGKGARFWFEVHAQQALTTAAVRPRRLAGRCVLVTSPAKTVREAARMQIEAAGGAAHAFASMRTLAACRDEGPVLIDLACTGARPVEGRASLVMLRPDERGRIPDLLAAGFAGYLIKPLRQASLVERVLAVTGGAGRKALAAHDERGQAAERRGLRVLLAEDDPVNALLAKALLAREGCHIRHAASGEEAVEAASVESFGLILMDRRLPGIDGLEAARRLREAGVATPIVALTADAYDEDRRACLAAGMDDFLPKPLDQTALRAVLARLATGAFTETDRTAKLAS